MWVIMAGALGGNFNAKPLRRGDAKMKMGVGKMIREQRRCDRKWRTEKGEEGR